MVSLVFWINNDQKFQILEYFSAGKKDKVNMYVLIGGEVQNIYFKNVYSRMIHVMIKRIPFFVSQSSVHIYKWNIGRCI